MTQMEFERARYVRKYELVMQEFQLRKSGPLSQNEKDWFSLMNMRYGIAFGSKAFRWGHIGALRRAIKRLEKELSDEERRRLLGSDSGNSDSKGQETGEKEAEKNVR